MANRIAVRIALILALLGAVGMPCHAAKPAGAKAAAKEKVMATTQTKPTISKIKQQEPEAEAKWLESLDKARKSAAQLKRPILMDFTGSDWCIWCKRLDADVFAEAAFKEYAKANLVLLTVDFPETKPQAEEVVKQNKALSDKYEVKGYPTILITDASGKELGRLVGYQRGGPEAFVKSIKEILAPPSPSSATSPKNEDKK